MKVTTEHSFASEGEQFLTPIGPGHIIFKWWVINGNPELSLCEQCYLLYLVCFVAADDPSGLGAIRGQR